MTERVRTYMRFSSDNPDAPVLRRLRRDAMRTKPPQTTKRSVPSLEKGKHIKRPKLTDADSPPTDVNLTGPHPYASGFDSLVATSSIETSLEASSRSS